MRLKTRRRGNHVTERQRADRDVASAFNGNRVAAGTARTIGRFPQDRAALAPLFLVATRT